jgi:predicted acetyltransferase
MSKTEIRTNVEGHWHNRELLFDGEPVSYVAVPDHHIRILGVEVRMGGIGGVRTEREHRMKGHSRRLMEDTVRYMTELSQDVSMLWGISDFYCKFGFAPFMAEHSTHVATRDAEKLSAAAAPYEVRPLGQEDLEFVREQYEADNRMRSCALVRDAEHFRGFHRGSSYFVDAVAVVLEQAGRPAAYLVYDENATEVKAVEANAVSWQAFGCILAELTRLAIGRRCGHIEVHSARDHAFARYLRRCGCRVQSDYPRMGNGMMRVLNQDGLFDKLKPAMETRLGASEFRGIRVRLRVETDLGTSELRLGADGAGGTADMAVSLRQDQLMQLIAGYRRADDILEEPDVEASDGVARLLDVVFGGQEPYVWKADRF